MNSSLPPVFSSVSNTLLPNTFFVKYTPSYIALLPALTGLELLILINCCCVCSLEGSSVLLWARYNLVTPDFVTVALEEGFGLKGDSFDNESAGAEGPQLSLSFSINGCSGKM